jgi:hypothetical protein
MKVCLFGRARVWSKSDKESEVRDSWSDENEPLAMNEGKTVMVCEVDVMEDVVLPGMAIAALPCFCCRFKVTLQEVFIMLVTIRN